MSNYASVAQMPFASVCPRCMETPRHPLTKRQAEIMAYLREFIGANGYAPSFEEIAAKFGYSSLATVHEHLASLQRRGWIVRRYNESRAIELVGEPIDADVDRLTDDQVRRICAVLNEDKP